MAVASFCKEMMSQKAIEREREARRRNVQQEEVIPNDTFLANLPPLSERKGNESRIPAFPLPPRGRGARGRRALARNVGDENDGVVIGQSGSRNRGLCGYWILAGEDPV